MGEIMSFDILKKIISSDNSDVKNTTTNNNNISNTNNNTNDLKKVSIEDLNFGNQSEVKHWSIFGGTGRGKSYFVKNKIMPILVKKNIKTIIIDPQNEYTNIPKTELNTVIEDISHPSANIIRYVPLKARTKEERDKKLIELDMLYSKIYNHLRGVCLIIDEVHIAGGEQHKLLTGLLELLSTGRKLNIKVIIISQRISRVDKDITGHCTIKTFFKVNENIDWNRLRETLTDEQFNFIKNSENRYANITIVDGEIYASE